MDWKSKYCQDANSSQLDLQIKCNTNQNPTKLFHEYLQTNSKLYVERKKTTAYTIPKNKGLTLPNFKNYHNGTVNQDNVVMVKEQTN